MRRFAVMSGLAITVAALPLVSQAACEARPSGSIFSALAKALAGRPATQCLPGDNRAKAVAAPIAEPAPRPVAEACRYDALPHYDAAGQATLRPARACGLPAG